MSKRHSAWGISSLPVTYTLAQGLLHASLADASAAPATAFLSGIATSRISDPSDTGSDAQSGVDAQSDGDALFSDAGRDAQAGSDAMFSEAGRDATSGSCGAASCWQLRGERL